MDSSAALVACTLLSLFILSNAGCGAPVDACYTKNIPKTASPCQQQNTSSTCEKLNGCYNATSIELCKAMKLVGCQLACPVDPNTLPPSPPSAPDPNQQKKCEDSTNKCLGDSKVQITAGCLYYQTYFECLDRAGSFCYGPQHQKQCDHMTNSLCAHQPIKCPVSGAPIPAGPPSAPSVPQAQCTKDLSNSPCVLKIKQVVDSTDFCAVQKANTECALAGDCYTRNVYDSCQLFASTCPQLVCPDYPPKKNQTFDKCGMKVCMKAQLTPNKCEMFQVATDCAVKGGCMDQAELDDCANWRDSKDKDGKQFCPKLTCPIIPNPPKQPVCKDKTAFEACMMDNGFPDPYKPLPPPNPLRNFLADTCRFAQARALCQHRQDCFDVDQCHALEFLCPGVVRCPDTNVIPPHPPLVCPVEQCVAKAGLTSPDACSKFAKQVECSKQLNCTTPQLEKSCNKMEVICFHFGQKADCAALSSLPTANPITYTTRPAPCNDKTVDQCVARKRDAQQKAGGPAPLNPLCTETMNYIDCYEAEDCYTSRMHEACTTLLMTCPNIQCPAPKQLLHDNQRTLAQCKPDLDKCVNDYSVALGAGTACQQLQMKVECAELKGCYTKELRDDCEAATLEKGGACAGLTCPHLHIKLNLTAVCNVDQCMQTAKAPSASTDPCGWFKAKTGCINAADCWFQNFEDQCNVMKPLCPGVQCKNSKMPCDQGPCYNSYGFNSKNVPTAGDKICNMAEAVEACTVATACYNKTAICDLTKSVCPSGKSNCDKDAGGCKTSACLAQFGFASEPTDADPKYCDYIQKLADCAASESKNCYSTDASAKCDAAAKGKCKMLACPLSTPTTDLNDCRSDIDKCLKRTGKFNVGGCERAQAMVSCTLASDCYTLSASESCLTTQQTLLACPSQLCPAASFVRPNIAQCTLDKCIAGKGYDATKDDSCKYITLAVQCSREEHCLETKTWTACQGFLGKCISGLPCDTSTRPPSLPSAPPTPGSMPSSVPGAVVPLPPSAIPCEAEVQNCVNRILGPVANPQPCDYLITPFQCRYDLSRQGHAQCWNATWSSVCKKNAAIQLCPGRCPTETPSAPQAPIPLPPQPIKCSPKQIRDSDCVKNKTKTHAISFCASTKAIIECAIADDCYTLDMQKVCDTALITGCTNLKDCKTIPPAQNNAWSGCKMDACMRALNQGDTDKCEIMQDIADCSYFGGCYDTYEKMDCEAWKPACNHKALTCPTLASLPPARDCDDGYKTCMMEDFPDSPLDPLPEPDDFRYFDKTTCKFAQKRADCQKQHNCYDFKQCKAIQLMCAPLVCPQPNPVTPPSPASGPSTPKVCEIDNCIKPKEPFLFPCDELAERIACAKKLNCTTVALVKSCPKLALFCGNQRKDIDCDFSSITGSNGSKFKPPPIVPCNSQTVGRCIAKKGAVGHCEEMRAWVDCQLAEDCVNQFSQTNCEAVSALCAPGSSAMCPKFDVTTGAQVPDNINPVAGCKIDECVAEFVSHWSVNASDFCEVMQIRAACAVKGQCYKPEIRKQCMKYLPSRGGKCTKLTCPHNPLPVDLDAVCDVSDCMRKQKADPKNVCEWVKTWKQCSIDLKCWNLEHVQFQCNALSKFCSTLKCDKSFPPVCDITKCIAPFGLGIGKPIPNTCSMSDAILECVPASCGNISSLCGFLEKQFCPNLDCQTEECNMQKCLDNKQYDVLNPPKKGENAFCQFIQDKSDCAAASSKICYQAQSENDCKMARNEPLCTQLTCPLQVTTTDPNDCSLVVDACLGMKGADQIKDVCKKQQIAADCAVATNCYNPRDRDLCIVIKNQNKCKQLECPAFEFMVTEPDASCNIDPCMGTKGFIQGTSDECKYLSTALACSKEQKCMQASVINSCRQVKQVGLCSSITCSTSHGKCDDYLLSKCVGHDKWRTCIATTQVQGKYDCKCAQEKIKCLKQQPECWAAEQKDDKCCAEQRTNKGCNLGCGKCAGVPEPSCSQPQVQACMGDAWDVCGDQLQQQNGATASCFCLQIFYKCMKKQPKCWEEISNAGTCCLLQDFHPDGECLLNCPQACSKPPPKDLTCNQKLDQCYSGNKTMCDSRQGEFKCSCAKYDYSCPKIINDASCGAKFTQAVTDKCCEAAGPAFHKQCPPPCALNNQCKNYPPPMCEEKKYKDCMNTVGCLDGNGDLSRTCTCYKASFECYQKPDQYPTCWPHIAASGACKIVEQSFAAQNNPCPGICPDECAPGCSTRLRQNAVCDAPCDVVECQHDDGKCQTKQCAPGCTDKMLLNGKPDPPCCNQQCNMDKGQCHACDVTTCLKDKFGIVGQGSVHHCKYWNATMECAKMNGCAGDFKTRCQIVVETETCTNVRCTDQKEPCRQSAFDKCLADHGMKSANPPTADCKKLYQFYLCSKTAFCQSPYNYYKCMELNNAANCTKWFNCAAIDVPDKCPSECDNDDSAGLCTWKCNVPACKSVYGACQQSGNCDSKCTSALIKNGKCDPECNNWGCKWDDGACVPTCGANKCKVSLLGDGTCDDDCNVKDCEFDKGDCKNKDCAPGCTKDMQSNSVCDSECDNQACSYDDNKCATAPSPPTEPTAPTAPNPPTPPRPPPPTIPPSPPTCPGKCRSTKDECDSDCYIADCEKKAPKMYKNCQESCSESGRDECVFTMYSKSGSKVDAACCTPGCGWRNPGCNCEKYLPDFCDDLKKAKVGTDEYKKLKYECASRNQCYTKKMREQCKVDLPALKKAYSDFDCPKPYLCAQGCTYNMRGNGNCDEQCKNADCWNDMGDCSDRDTCDTNDKKCYWPSIYNGKCEEDCNQVGACDFDGQACKIKSECTAKGCDVSMFGNGECDAKCNFAECEFDKGECPGGTHCPPKCQGAGADNKCSWECFTPACEFELGDCHADNFCDKPTTGKPQCDKQLQNNKRCDKSCNVATCSFDNYRCFVTKECPSNCASGLWEDGKCQAECQIRACAFDAADCANKTTCPCATGDNIELWFDDKCDDVCNTAECNYDNGQCTTNTDATGARLVDAVESEGSNGSLAALVVLSILGVLIILAVAGGLYFVAQRQAAADAGAVEMDGGYRGLERDELL